jgi:hypothetical protein
MAKANSFTSPTNFLPDAYLLSQKMFRTIYLLTTFNVSWNNYCFSIAPPLLKHFTVIK